MGPDSPADFAEKVGVTVRALNNYLAGRMLAKVLMPYLRVSDYVTSALDEGNIAAALVVLARTALVLGILALLVIWGK